jgi:hypothetical protein
VVEHDARLDILCCLADGGPLEIEQVSGRTGMRPTLTKHHAQILDAFGLVGKTQKGGVGPTLYVARLQAHPPWVREAVEKHKRAVAG